MLLELEKAVQAGGILELTAMLNAFVNLHGKCKAADDAIGQAIARIIVKVCQICFSVAQEGMKQSGLFWSYQALVCISPLKYLLLFWNKSQTRSGTSLRSYI